MCKKQSAGPMRLLELTNELNKKRKDLSFVKILFPEETKGEGNNYGYRLAKLAKL